MKRIHYLLTGLSLTILLLSLNRLTESTQTHLQPHDYLRWLDFNAMLPIPLISIILYYLLKREITFDHPFLKTSLYVFLNILLISGIYLFGAGSGDHEVTNYLNYRFCDGGKIISPICNVIAYNDDSFSHYVYYIGFILMNVALIYIEHYIPRPKPISSIDSALIAANSIFIAAGIFANLAFEESTLDMYVFTSVMLLSMYLLFSTKLNWKHRPLTLYFTLSYSLGVVGTAIYKTLPLLG